MPPCWSVSRPTARAPARPRRSPSSRRPRPPTSGCSRRLPPTSPVPELPEVETVRAGVARHVLGRQVRRAVVHHPRAARRHDGGGVDLAGRLTGRTLTAAVRRGKYLWLTLDGDDEALLIHLGMSGQLLIRHASPGPSTTTPPPPAPTPPPPATGPPTPTPA